MIALPWYLGSAGILIVVVGFILAGAMNPPGSGQRAIDPDMSDDEIAQNLQNRERVSLPQIVIFVGLLCIMVSLVWRIVLWIF